METILSTIQLCSNIYMIYIYVCVCLYLYIYFFCVYFTHHMVTHNRWHPLTPSICQPLAPLRFQPINSTFRHFSFSILHDYFLFLFDICISFCLWLVSLVGYKSIWQPYIVIAIAITVVFVVVDYFIQVYLCGRNFSQLFKAHSINCSIFHLYEYHNLEIREKKRQKLEQHIWHFGGHRSLPFFFCRISLINSKIYSGFPHRFSHFFRFDLVDWLVEWLPSCLAAWLPFQLTVCWRYDWLADDECILQWILLSQ